MLIRFILRAIFAAVGLWVAARYVPGIHVNSLETLAIAALVLGLVNAFIRPIVVLLTLPFTLITFGLFLFVINAGMLWLVAMFLRGFEVHGFVAALLGSIVVSLAGWVGSLFIHSDRR
jgi:putative membrane protein